MKLTSSAICSLFALVALCAFGTAKTQETQDSTVLPYLVQEVCVNSSRKVLRIDPYFCPKTDTLRQLQIGEPLPYHKHNQVDPATAMDRPLNPDRDGDLELHDSYPVRALNGNVLSINPFDFEPDSFHAYLGGYDVYRITDGWATAEETRDSGGFSITWFGANCQWNGWLFFPMADLTPSGINAGDAIMPMAGGYWEKDGQHWPGACPSTYQASLPQSAPVSMLCNPGANCPSTYQAPLESWEFIPNYPFAGIGKNPVKRLDAIRTIHNYSNTPQFLAHGNLEVFYFTKLYGSTRWEEWAPAKEVEADPQEQQTAAQVSKYCKGTGDVEYHGVKYVVIYCRDWSAVSVLDKPEPPAPWPIPDLNLLQNFHFDQGFENWKRTISAGGMHWSLKTSTEARDLQNKQREGVGIRYLALTCTADCSASSRIYQDIPITAKTTSGRYSLGARVRAEGRPGTLRLAVTVLDGERKILTGKSFTESAPLPGGPEADSVVLSGNFDLKSFPITIDPRASVLRFSISPTTSGTFDIVDAWLMRDTY